MDADKRIETITKMNIRWQKYSKHQDNIITDLRIKQKEDKAKILELESVLTQVQEQYETMEFKFTDARVRADGRKRQLVKVSSDFDQLQHKFNASNQEAVWLKNRCSDLIDKINDVQTTAREEIELCKQQVRIIFVIVFISLQHFSCVEHFHEIV